MTWSSPEFVLSMFGLWILGSLAANWIRARHGYPLDETSAKEKETSKRLLTENSELREQVSHFAERVKVLERIATDGSVNIAAQIEALRDEPKITAQLEKELR